MTDYVQWERNLYSFYESMLGAESITLKCGDEYSYIYSDVYNWPRYVFGLTHSGQDLNPLINQVATSIRNKKIPPFVIVNQNYYGATIEPVFEQNGMRKIDYWPVMSLNTDQDKPEAASVSKLSISPVVNSADLTEWFSIVKEVLFPHKKIPFDFFNSRLRDKKYIFLLGRKNGIPIATSMLFISEGIAGLYMVATREEFRKQGFGQLITHESLEEARSQGIQYVTLQSSKAAYNMYIKIGFKHLYNLDIYWMLGKEFKF